MSKALQARNIIKQDTVQETRKYAYTNTHQIIYTKCNHSLIYFRFLFYKNMVVIYVFLLEEAMYSYCYLCILIVSLCYKCLCVVYVFSDSATLTEVFPCFFLSCKANARVNLAKTGHGPHFPKLLCCSTYCLFCVVLCIVCV